ncbi:hypothetical protein TNCV_4949901 [Trichonephila clavipes]|nr:hypothetical protein TNCV_4949901 [Trichonephila clavipes]
MTCCCQQLIQSIPERDVHRGYFPFKYRRVERQMDINYIRAENLYCGVACLWRERSQFRCRSRHWNVVLKFKRKCTMRYDRALRHTSSVGCLHSIFAVTLPLVRSNSWDAQLTVPNDPRYARLETHLRIKLAKEG